MLLHEAGGKLEPFEYELGSLKPDEVEIDVEYCGICHSDLSMLKNEWGFTRYPFVPGHEVVGRVSSIGNMVNHLNVGQYVGLGWRARSCLVCDQCLSGHHNRCLKGEDVIVYRHGAYADKVRCQALWAFPLPKNINTKTAGPLFCGGITVFNPIIQNNIKPTDHVAVVGIGGLGHMAIKFLNSWGCEVTAVSSNPEKERETQQFGAHHFLNSRDPNALKSKVKPNREQTPRKVKTGRKAAKIFNASIYHYRGLIEGIFGAEETKHHQLYCRFRLKNNQKRFGLIKSIGWNLEVLNRLQCANKLGLKITQYAISN